MSIAAGMILRGYALGAPCPAKGEGRVTGSVYEQWAAASRGMRGRRCVLGAGDVAWGWRRLARTGRGVLVEAGLAWGGQAPVAAIERSPLPRSQAPLHRVIGPVRQHIRARQPSIHNAQPQAFNARAIAQHEACSKRAGRGSLAGNAVTCVQEVQAGRVRSK